MKKNIIISVLLLFSLELQAMTTDSLLVYEYQRGLQLVYEKIEQENLTDSLSGLPYCALFYDNLWIIAALKEKQVIIFSSYNFYRQEMKTYKFPSETKELNNIFALVNQSTVELCVRHSKKKYFPSFYFVLFNTEHQKIYEWNNVTMPSKKHKRTKEFYVKLSEYICFITSNVNDY